MTQTSELGRPPVDNGTASLNDRVRSLRLTQQPTAKTRSSVLPWSLCAILVLTTTAFGYRAYRVGGLEPSAANPSETGSNASTNSSTSVAASGEVVLQAKGYVVPAHQVQLSPKVGGMIVKLNERFEEGQFFKKDEPLAWLEEIDYKADLDHALQALAAAKQRWEESKKNRDEDIEQAKNELEEYKATLKQLEIELRRNESLSGTNALSAREFDQSKFAYDAMARRVKRLSYAYELMKKGPRQEKRDAAEADMQAAQADADKADWRLKNCVIRAPISGHILTKKAELGAVVNPLALSISASLCDMADLGNLEIDLSVQERDIARVEKGQACTIMPEAYQNHEPFRKIHSKGYSGVVVRLMPIADRSKGAINVRVQVTDIPKEEIGKLLRPEMSVLVSFLKTSK
jgi:multidrug resistance efflux pump